MQRTAKLYLHTHDNEELERGTFHLRGLECTDVIIIVAVVRVSKYRKTKKKKNNFIYNIYIYTLVAGKKGESPYP